VSKPLFEADTSQIQAGRKAYQLCQLVVAPVNILVPGSLFAHRVLYPCECYVLRCAHVVFVLSFHCTLQVLDVSVRTVFHHAHARSVTAHTAACSPTTAAVGPTRCAGQRAVPSGESVGQWVSPCTVLVLYILVLTVLPCCASPLAAPYQAPVPRTPRAHPSPLMKLKGRGGEATDIP
jgi:hypothetical protein